MVALLSAAILPEGDLIPSQPRTSSLARPHGQAFVTDYPSPGAYRKGTGISDVRGRDCSLETQALPGEKNKQFLTKEWECEKETPLSLTAGSEIVLLPGQQAEEWGVGKQKSLALIRRLWVADL